MRKLASIQRVVEITPIDGADRIEVARVNEWRCVVKKGEFRVGDLATYLEIDSVPPDDARFNWLWTKDTDVATPPRPSNFRIRTKKLRGVVSQGLLLPLMAVRDDAWGWALENDDVSEFLGVTKYEPPEPGTLGVPGTKRASDFPSFVPRTDEERIQSNPRLLGKLQGQPYVATLKYDGTSFTAVYNPATEAVMVCSRNYVVSTDEENRYATIAKRYGLLQTLLDPEFQRYAIQGEIVGPSIQNNRLGLHETELWVFSVYDVERRQYLPQEALERVCLELALNPVEVVECGLVFNETVQTLLEKARGKYAGTKNHREGLVYRHALQQPPGELISFKIVNNDYLLAESD